MGKYHNGRTQGPGSGCASPASHRHSESGGATGTVPVCRNVHPMGYWTDLFYGEQFAKHNTNSVDHSLKLSKSFMISPYSHTENPELETEILI